MREGLLNAIIHRDYSLNGSILISIYSNRIEYVSIGGLVSGMTYNDMMLGVSRSRNERLANIFFKLNYVEAYGTGIEKFKVIMNIQGCRHVLRCLIMVFCWYYRIKSM